MENILVKRHAVWNNVELDKHNLYKYIYVLSIWNIWSIIMMCKKQNIRIIFPVKYDDYIELNNNRHILNANKIFYLAPDTKNANIFKNKKNFVNWMIENSMSLYIPEIYESPKIPCVIKKSISCGGTATYLIDTEKKFTEYNKKLSSFLLNNYVIQEYIKSNIEYCTHLLCHGGQIIKYTSNKYTFENDHIKTHGSKHTTEKYVLDSNILEIFANIVKLNNWSGLCCVDFKIVKHNDIPIPKIFEINERIGRSLLNNQIELEDFMKEYIRLCLP